MQFGVQFFPAVDHTDKSAAEYYAESLTIAEEAETLGFTHARTVEHYFNRYGGYSPNPIVFLSAASQRTKRVRLVTGAVLPVFNNPLKLAGEISMLDAIEEKIDDIIQAQLMRRGDGKSRAAETAAMSLITQRLERLIQHRRSLLAGTDARAQQRRSEEERLGRE